MTYYDVVNKLIGQIKPVGSTEIDDERFENLKATIELVEMLMAEIEYVAKDTDTHEYSIKRAAEYASDFLASFKKEGIQTI